MVHTPLHLLLVVGLKNALLVVLGDASALICHTDCDTAIVVWCKLCLSGHCYRCLRRRIFYRVRDKVGQDLLRSLDIEPDLDVPQRAQLRLNLDPNLVCLHLMQVDTIFDMLTQVCQADHGHDCSAF